MSEGFGFGLEIPKRVSQESELQLIKMFSTYLRTEGLGFGLEIV